MATFVHGGHRIAYTEHGSGERVVVLLHGLLLDQRLMDPLAQRLSRRGYRTVTLDLLGHGASDRPREMWAYSMTAFGEQVVGLLDHLAVDTAVLGGLSLGANVALEAAALAPDRVRALILEMPVLDHAMVGCAVAFAPLMLALTVGEPGLRLVSAAARQLPRPTGRARRAGDVLGWLRQDPRPTGALLQGLLFARIAPPSSIRRTLAQPALVIGHRGDRLHPFADASALADELEHGRLIRASSILEMRLAPQRLTREIARFLDEAWPPDAAAPRRREPDRRGPAPPRPPTGRAVA